MQDRELYAEVVRIKGPWFVDRGAAPGRWRSPRVSGACGVPKVAMPGVPVTRGALRPSAGEDVAASGHVSLTDHPASPAATDRLPATLGASGKAAWAEASSGFTALFE